MPSAVTLLLALVGLELAWAGTPAAAHDAHAYAANNAQPFVAHDAHAFAARAGNANAALQRTAQLLHAPSSAATPAAAHELPNIGGASQCPDHDGGPCSCHGDRCTGSHQPRPVIGSVATVFVPASLPPALTVSVASASPHVDAAPVGSVGSRAPPVLP